MIKSIGIIFIMFSSSALGYLLGSRFKMRVKELMFLKISLQMLETEIVYSNTPLPDAFEGVQQRSTTPIRELFKGVSNNLKQRSFNSVGDAFAKAIDGIKDITSLNKEDLEILKSFGYSIGNSDTDGQVKSFKLIFNQISGQEMKAEDIRKKSEKMYKSLGFLSGLAITILLI